MINFLAIFCFFSTAAEFIEFHRDYNVSWTHNKEVRPYKYQLTFPRSMKGYFSVTENFRIYALLSSFISTQFTTQEVKAPNYFSVSLGFTVQRLFWKIFRASISFTDLNFLGNSIHCHRQS